MIGISKLSFGLRLVIANLRLEERGEIINVQSDKRAVNALIKKGCLTSDGKLTSDGRRLADELIEKYPGKADNGRWIGHA